MPMEKEIQEESKEEKKEVGTPNRFLRKPKVKPLKIKRPKIFEK